MENHIDVNVAPPPWNSVYLQNEIDTTSDMIPLGRKYFTKQNDIRISRSFPAFPLFTNLSSDPSSIHFLKTRPHMTECLD